MAEEERWIESESLQRQQEDADDDAMTDLFADPDPLETFRFSWTLKDAREIQVELSGHKAELGQTLHSTGLTLWRASELLCDYLVQQDEWIKEKKVLELGAGLGLCGILSHHLKAAKVVMTDGDTDTLENLRSNVQSNCPNNTETVLCRQLVWGRNVDTFVETHGQFHTILGSDIIYVEEILEPLWQTVDQVLAPGGSFLLAYARRNVSIDLVLAQATKHGFVWEMPEAAEGVFVFKRTT